MAERIITVKRWPPEFRLCAWCLQRRVRDCGEATRFCKECDEVITRDRMSGYRGHDYSQGDRDDVLGLFPFADIIV